jgi:hypothetical protein
LASVAGTAFALVQEVSMRKAFLAEDPEARVILRNMRPSLVATFPYGHPRGIVCFLSVLSSCATWASLQWQIFVSYTVFACNEKGACGSLLGW